MTDQLLMFLFDIAEKHATNEQLEKIKTDYSSILEAEIINIQNMSQIISTANHSKVLTNDENMLASFILTELSEVVRSCQLIESNARYALERKQGGKQS